jgi:hypothetical protein
LEPVSPSLRQVSETPWGSLMSLGHPEAIHDSRSAMRTVEENEEREHRIAMEAVVDAYGEVERAMGWYYYLDDKLRFPFRAKCVAERCISPLQEGEEVEVQGMAPEEECMHEMFVQLHWSGRKLAVPLSQLAALEADADTQEAIEDWHYWVARGYQF